MTGKKYGGSLAYEYVYSDQGELTTVRDIVNGNTTNFLYDLSGRLVKTTDTDNKWVFGYDTHSNMNSIDKTQFGVQEKESITFDLDNKVTDFKLHQGTVKKLEQNVVYDAIGRIESIGTKDGTDVTRVAKSYEYKKVIINETTTSDTTLVSKETIGSMIKDYTYDLKGNITSITVGGNTISYTYDLIGQLLTEDNEVTGEYIVYDYDTGGNIQTKTVTLNGGTPVVYNYGYDSVWKDKLVSFDGKSLTYDAIGNPLTIGDSVLTWIQGRKLSTFKKDATSDTATYTYDENGIRKTKVVGNKVIEYITSGGEVVAQRSNNGTTGDSSDDVVITFTRGADGSLISMNRNGTTYYYVTNIQGDVEKILTSSGTVVVEYIYDAYGKVVSISGDFASTIGEENPFRYRSYYFDSESGYYYLQSRYYDPLMGRFINADDRIVDNGNMFSYCNNNPVNNFDPTGHWSISSWAKDTWKSVKSWWNNKPGKSKITIPSSSGMLSSISDSALGSTAQQLHQVKGKAKFQSRNGYIEPIPLGGKDVLKFPNVIKNINRVSTGLTVATTAMDLGNTWTDNNDNTNGDRVVKSGIQVTGVALSIGTSYVAFAAFNAWNPIGWVMTTVAVVTVGAVIVGSNIAIGKGQQKIYNETGIE